MLNNKDRKQLAKVLISVGVPVTLTFVSWAIFKKPLVVIVGGTVLLGSGLYLSIDEIVNGPHINENDRYVTQQKDEMLNNMFNKEEYSGRKR